MGKPLVLIIEDNIIFEEIFRPQLENYVEIHWSYTGEDAIRFFAQHISEVVLVSTDGTVGMRDMVELIQLLRDKTKGNYTGPILAASAGDDHNQRLVDAGATRAVRKDRVPKEILKELNIVTQQRDTFH